MAETRVEAIRRLARRGALAPLRRTLEKSRPVDIASAIGHLAPTEQRTVLGSLTDDDDAALNAGALTPSMATQSRGPAVPEVHPAV